jgi:hypothetical protein
MLKIKDYYKDNKPLTMSEKAELQMYTSGDEAREFILVLNNTGHTNLNLIRDEIMKILEGKEYRIQPNLLVSTSVAGYIV